MAKKRQMSPRTVVMVMALLLMPAAAALAYFGYAELELASASERSVCDVLGVGTGDVEQGTAHQPWVILVHTVAGDRFERRDVGPRCDGASEAAALVEGLRPGARVECRYPVGKPSMVAYFEHSATKGQALLAGAALLLLVVLGTFGWARRRPGWT